MNRIVQFAAVMMALSAFSDPRSLGMGIGDDQTRDVLSSLEKGHIEGDRFGYSMAPSMAGTQKVIIDADPAMGYLFKDIDDGLMLSMALRDPRLEVLGITVEFGNTNQSRAYDKAREIVEIMGRSDVPVLRGSDIPGVDQESDASRFIVEQAHKYPGRVKVLAVGALTNLASALAADPAVANLIQEVVAVGGNVRADEGAPRIGSPYDLNFGSDPECARIVFESDLPVTVVPIDLCRQFRLDWPTFRQATRGLERENRYLRTNSWMWFVVKAGSMIPWDIVGLSYLRHPQWFDQTRTNIDFRVAPGIRPWVTLHVADDGPIAISILTSIEGQDRFHGWLQDSL